MLQALVLLLTHILSEFYFQSDKSIIKKEGNIKLNKPISHKVLLVHVSIYSLLSLIVFLFYKSNLTNYFIVFIILFASHYLVDLFKLVLNRKLKNTDNEVNKQLGILFIIDQVIHIVVLVLLAWFIDIEFTKTFIYDFVFEHLFYLKLIIVILLVCKPFNVTFKALFDNYKPKPKNPEAREIGYEEDKQNITDISNGGSLIGSLERILILICLLTNNFATIGFVITAKSVVRFKKLDIQGFAEYFLIGTLVSIIGTLTIYHLFFTLL